MPYSGRTAYVSRKAFCECVIGEQKWQEHCAKREQEQRDRIERWIEAAGIPNRYYAASFESFPDKSAGWVKVKAWATWPDPDEEDDWCANVRKDGLYLYGDYGTGKTSLAVAAMKRLCVEENNRPMFLTTTDLLDRIRRSFDGEKDAVLEEAQAVPLLVLDDVGAERVTEWVEERLFSLINRRYNDQATTIFTSNMNAERLAEHIGERTAWRIMEMCAVIKLDGKNLRQRSTGK